MTISRRSVLIVSAGLVLLAVAFGAGAWVGGDMVGNFHQACLADALAATAK